MSWYREWGEDLAIAAVELTGCTIQVAGIAAVVLLALVVFLGWSGP